MIKVHVVSQTLWGGLKILQVRFSMSNTHGNKIFTVLMTYYQGSRVQIKLTKMNHMINLINQSCACICVRYDLNIYNCNI